MKRREFIGLLGGAAAWPLAARAQQPPLPVIGFVRSTSLADAAPFVAAFRQGLKEAGFVEGQNVAVEYHYADGRVDRLQAVVADLVRRRVDVIAGNGIAMLVAKAATATVPIVFAGGGDPVQQGLVASLNRPGGNVTGAYFFAGAVGAKRLELLGQLVPKATTLGMLVHPGSRETETERREVQAAAQAIGKPLVVIDVTSETEIESAFATLIQHKVDAVLVGAGPFLTSHRERLTALASRHALPASYVLREYVTAGGLMSYGSSITDAFRQAGVYTARILKGEKPDELPVVRSSKFEFVLNVKAARALGLEVPDRLLALADEVIE
jgi:putative tryptophan/tyrosine transport system substrate-binding protein